MVYSQMNLPKISQNAQLKCFKQIFSDIAWTLILNRVKIRYQQGTGK